MELNSLFHVYYYFSYNNRLSVLDLVLLPVYLIIIYFIAKRTQTKNIGENPSYKYYISGLFAKFIGVIGFTLIYAYYYDGGDTFVYFENANAISNIILDEPTTGFSILSGNQSAENYATFINYSFKRYMWKDPQSFFIGRITVPMAFLGLQCYLLASIVTAFVTYSGIWRFYLMFSEVFPLLRKELAIAILFMPSVCFWGSGILKDSWTIAAAGWLTYSFYNIFIKKTKKSFIKYSITSLISSFILLSVKPYILFSLLFGFFIWILFHRLKSIKSNFHRIIIFPSIFILSWVVGSTVISYTGKIVGGDYESLDKMVNKADVIRSDLVRSEQYGNNNFDIGTYNKNDLVSIMMKIPQAMTAGLFRPFIWEVKNIVMMLSGIENLFLLLMTIYIVFNKGPMFLINTMFDHPLILFSFVFAMVFAFSIGFSTSNFGALVRYKIPLIPFYMAALFFVRNKQIVKRNIKESESVVPVFLNKNASDEKQS